MRFAIVVPWVREGQIEDFLRAWGIDSAAPPEWLILMHDKEKRGCAATKNAGVDAAMERDAEVVVLLDDDCFPHGEVRTLEALAEAHVAALEPVQVPLFRTVTTPPSRGTPYANLTAEKLVAASMGFWAEVGDYCAARQLAFGSAPMTFDPTPVFGQYFPLCAMNLAFRPQRWQPWCRLIDVPRFDDIWMGWLWQREAYSRGYCFNLGGPVVRHSRQSDPFRNLEVEARHLRANETLWSRIASNPSGNYGDLLALLPQDAGGSDR